MIKNVHFVKDGKGYQVQEWKDEKGYDWNNLGTLEFDNDQKAWIFWPIYIDDGVTYYENLEETIEEIKQEILEN